MHKTSFPYLSIVVTGRNDNHGGDMLRRTTLFVKGLMHQCNKFKLPVELVFVEWNPAGDKPLLSEVLPKPTDSDYLTIRYIIVPSSVHQERKNSDKIQLHQMIAKNVGIRRASGKFVLCTNLDILFSSELFDFLSHQQLNKDFFYRANRCDVPANIDEKLPDDELLEFCRHSIIRWHGFNTKYVEQIGFPEWLKHPIIYPLTRLFTKPLRKYFYPLNSFTDIIDHTASGDFTLMAKEAWEKIDGYIEIDIFPLNIDSLALDAAIAVGIKQIVLPAQQCVYHIDHEGGWASLNPLEAMHYIIEHPVLDLSVSNHAADYIIRNRLKFKINKPNWGYNDYTFQEIVLPSVV